MKKMYIDRFITCKLPKYEENIELTDLAPLQTHRHSHICKKEKRKKCRFGFPKPPLHKTMILQPLSVHEVSKAEKPAYTKLYKEIEDFLTVFMKKTI